jgi:hypothetical protein
MDEEELKVKLVSEMASELSKLHPLLAHNIQREMKRTQRILVSVLPPPV